jgi:hypothetical protein
MRSNLFIMEQYLRNEYSKYLFNCEMQGDIWWLTNRAYDFQEWVEEGCPENGGVTLKKTM